VAVEKLIGPLPPSVYQLNHTVQNHAQPKIDNQTQVEPVRTMTSRRRQMRHQNKEVKQVADNHGNRLLEDFSKHLLTWTPATAAVMREKQQLALGN
jgi:hypothetical protein